MTANGIGPVRVGVREIVAENPAHVRVQVFIGRNEGARALTGVLTLRRDEWEELVDAAEGGVWPVDVIAALDLRADGETLSASTRPTAPCELLRVRVDQVAYAIATEGPVPSYHRETLRRHRAEWPTLWEAIDDLLAARQNDNDRRNHP